MTPRNQRILNGIGIFVASYVVFQFINRTPFWFEDLFLTSDSAKIAFANWELVWLTVGHILQVVLSFWVWNKYLREYFPAWSFSLIALSGVIIPGLVGMIYIIYNPPQNLLEFYDSVGDRLRLFLFSYVIAWIPFVLSFLVGVLGIYLRNKMPEPKK